jgi:hypothetical protein
MRQMIFRSGLAEAYFHSLGRPFQECLGDADANAVVATKGISKPPENGLCLRCPHDRTQLLRCFISRRFVSGEPFSRTRSIKEDSRWTVSSRNARMVRYAFTMMLGTFASRILGLIREVLMAAYFGATRQLDAFLCGLHTLANLSRQLLAEGALSASFVPVFSQVLARDGKARAVNLARQAMTVLLFLGAAVVLGGIVAAPLLVRLMAPGFAPEMRALAEFLTRGFSRFFFSFLSGLSPWAS